MNTLIVPIKLSDIEIYISQTKAEGMAGFSAKAEYFGIYDNGRLMGFTSIQYYSGKAKFNNHYVFPMYRGQGLFKEMFDFSMREVKKRRIKTIIATCTKKSILLYLKNDAQVIKDYKHYTAVQIDLK